MNTPSHIAVVREALKDIQDHLIDGSLVCEAGKGCILPSEIKSALEALSLIEKEMEGLRAWCLAAFGTTHPEMQHHRKPTYTELEKRLEAAEGMAERMAEALRQIANHTENYGEEAWKQNEIAEKALTLWNQAKEKR